MKISKHLRNIFSGDRLYYSNIAIDPFLYLIDRARYYTEGSHPADFLTCEYLLSSSDALIDIMLSPEEDSPLLPGYFRTLTADDIYLYHKRIILDLVFAVVASNPSLSMKMRQLYDYLFDDKRVDLSFLDTWNELDYEQIPVSCETLWIDLISIGRQRPHLAHTATGRIRFATEVNNKMYLATEVINNFYTSQY